MIVYTCFIFVNFIKSKLRLNRRLIERDTSHRLFKPREISCLTKFEILGEGTARNGRYGTVRRTKRSCSGSNFPF